MGSKIQGSPWRNYCEKKVSTSLWWNRLNHVNLGLSNLEKRTWKNKRIMKKVWCMVQLRALVNLGSMISVNGAVLGYISYPKWECFQLKVVCLLCSALSFLCLKQVVTSTMSLEITYTSTTVSDLLYNGTDVWFTECESIWELDSLGLDMDP